MKSQKKIIAHRRKCRELGKNTGLSHYILLAPRHKKIAEEDND